MILLPFLVRCGFWPGPVARIPIIVAERPESSRSITVTNKSNSLTYTTASSLVCTSPLAVITVVGFFDILMVSNSAELRSLLLSICILAPESTTNSLFLRFHGGRSREYPFFRWREECSFVVLFELAYVFGKVPCLASGTSLLSFSLFLRSVLKFYSVRTSLMRYFDLHVSKRWSIILSDTCWT